MTVLFNKLSVVSCFLLVPFFGISQLLISYNQAPKIDFGKYKTYQVYGFNVAALPDFEPRKESINFLITEIDRHMQARGYEKVQAYPDLILNIGVVISEEQKMVQPHIRDAPRYMGQRNYHWEATEIVVQEYNAGTVILDVVETENNKLIWQAVSKSMVSPTFDQGKTRITKAVKKMFNKYPIKKKK